MKRILLLTLVLLLAASAHGQRRENFIAFGTVIDGDTVPHFILKDIHIEASSRLLTAREIKQNQKLIRNVKKMLPYARMARTELDKLEAECAAIPKKSERNKLIKEREKEILAQYTEDLKKFTFSQGMVLLKLVDRETSRTSYVIVNDLRGKLRAGFYQTFARLFGYNLKDHYDPRNNKQDNLIERIVLSIDCGQL